MRQPLSELIADVHASHCTDNALADRLAVLLNAHIVLLRAGSLEVLSVLQPRADLVAIPAAPSSRRARDLVQRALLNHGATQTAGNLRWRKLCTRDSGAAAGAGTGEAAVSIALGMPADTRAESLIVAAFRAQPPWSCSATTRRNP